MSRPQVACFPAYPHQPPNSNPAVLCYLQALFTGVRIKRCLSKGKLSKRLH